VKSKSEDKSQALVTNFYAGEAGKIAVEWLPGISPLIAELSTQEA
jgi:hypothetical protein